MICLTHYLDAALLLLISCFPSGFNMIVPTKAKYPIQTHCIINLFLAIILSLFLGGGNIVFRSTTVLQPFAYTIIIVLLTGFLCIVVEYAYAQIFFYAKNKAFAKAVKIPAYENCKWHMGIWVLVQAICEEIVLKCSVYYIIREAFHLENSVICCIILSLVFAINHVHSGKEQMIQKLIVGAIISIIYVINDGVIWFAIVPHAILNMSYFIIAQRRCVK